MDIFLDKPQNAFKALSAADYEDGDWLCKGREVLHVELEHRHELAKF
jgi:hypothetical protein